MTIPPALKAAKPVDAAKVDIKSLVGYINIGNFHSICGNIKNYKQLTNP